MSSSGYLKFNPNQREEVRKALGFEDEKDLNEAVEIFDVWVQKQNHFICRNFERIYLEAFLLAAKGSIEKAKSRLDKRCTFSTLMPDVFDDIRPDVDFQDMHLSVKHILMPTPTTNNCRVVLDKFIEEEIEKFDLMTFARYGVLMSEYLIHTDSVAGYIVVFDMSSIKSASVLMKFTPNILQKALLVLVDAYGHRLTQLHLINSSKFVDALVSLFKQSLNAKLASRIIVHRSCDTIKDHIPLECIPKEYGGSCGTILECHDAMSKEMASPKCMEFLQKAANYKTDEAKRLSSKFNEEYLGTPGSFRTLRVD